ncbi:AMP-binding protein [Mycobacterium spongiae]|uniref:Long-chain-fatty-acid--CoA ligase FadD13 n=1 Tax=Mycobacterium spongiae TaxID=886343 RepID=A0A975PV46_9MYCO|nr:AMP-binding protein [Mycobacterium spongiae]QUR65786.1 AMP-binding protein [Mycobacterium spongiae]
MTPQLRGGSRAAATKRPAAVASRTREELWALWQVARTGALKPLPPQRLVAVSRSMRNYGPLGAAVTMAAALHRDRTAVVDERGALSFAELEDRSNAVANTWHKRGLRAGDGVAILARNHRGFLDALFAAAKCGARIVLLNTDFGAPQIRDVLAREGADLLVHDDEFAHLASDVTLRLGCTTAFSEHTVPDSLETAVGDGDSSPPPPPADHAKLVILTSGTTGTPKGAPRAESRSLFPAGSLLSRVPFRAREVTECCVPLFHALGFGHVMLGLLLGSSLVLRRRFDARQTLDSLGAQRATAMIAVPVMLRRILDLGPTSRSGLDLSALRIVFVAGSALGATLCREAMDAFGPVLYNMYGSTEVAYATIATPTDLTDEPGCVGRPVPGTIVKLLGDAGLEVPIGQRGRIFVGNGIQFDGYTDGAAKESIGGLLSSGDVGHFDSAGRLFVDGRDDDMIVSGAENVFPAEVEETLSAHPQIREAAVVGVPDGQYGQRLRSFVALRHDARLSEQDVRDYVRDRLARFKVPRDVIFVEQLPRNPTGKVVKRLLSADDREEIHNDQ